MKISKVNSGNYTIYYETSIYSSTFYILYIFGHLHLLTMDMNNNIDIDEEKYIPL